MMRHALKSLTSSNNQSSARVVDGKLVLSFPHAITPVVWQMDLTQAKASALEVHENKDSGVSTLVLKTPGGSNTDIAPFEKKSQAVEALMAISRALENAQGQIRSGTTPYETVGTVHHHPRRGFTPGKWVAAVLALFMLLILINIWGSNLPRSPSSVTQDTSIAQDPASQAGVPMSADDFLTSTTP
jgi:hypothetical protein